LLLRKTLKYCPGLVDHYTSWKDDYQKGPSKTLKRLEKSISEYSEPIMSMVESEDLERQFRTTHEWRSIIESQVKSRLKLYPGSIKK